MPIENRWARLGPADWDAFAQAWLAELRGASPAPDRDFGQSVVMMNFTAVPEQQWQFILAAVAHAASEEEFGHIAAGPLEHLLGKHGEEYVGGVERRVASDPKFAELLAGVWKHGMTDEVWARVHALKAQYPPRPGQAQA
jgi:hypothetical protein